MHYLHRVNVITAVLLFSQIHLISSKLDEQEYSEDDDARRGFYGIGATPPVMPENDDDEIKALRGRDSSGEKIKVPVGIPKLIPLFTTKPPFPVPPFPPLFPGPIPLPPGMVPMQGMIPLPGKVKVKVPYLVSASSSESCSTCSDSFEEHHYRTSNKTHIRKKHTERGGKKVNVNLLNLRKEVANKTYQLANYLKTSYKQSILRKIGACTKGARKACIKACKTALKNACKTINCKNDLSKKFKKACKEKCNAKFE